MRKRSLRIGVVNFYPSENYGGILQYYALQSILQGYGHHVELIARRWGNWRNVKKIGIKGRIMSFIFSVSLFKKFTTKRCCVSKPILSITDLYDYAKTVDAVLAGSDQIWNVDCLAEMGMYFFLDWVPDSVRHLSYAASFGSDSFFTSKEEILKSANLLKKFETISVRELAGISICKEIFQINAECHIDPTMLLSVSDYDSLLASTTNHKNKYLLSYILDASNIKQEFVTKIASQEHLSIIDNNPVQRNLWQLLFRHNRKPSVEQWIRNIKDAEVVVTDSYHGMVFSIIFSKPFLCIGNTNRGLSRFESLLKTLHLSDKFVLSESSLRRLVSQTKVEIPKIDYNEVHSYLEKEKMRSYEYLGSL